MLIVPLPISKIVPLALVITIVQTIVRAGYWQTHADKHQGEYGNNNCY